MVAAVIPTSRSAGRRVASSAACSRAFGVTLHAKGVDLVVMFRGPDEDPLANLQRIVSRRIADAIIVTQTRRHDPRIAFLDATEMPFVAFGPKRDGEGHAWVDFDFEAAAAAAVRLFAEAGHRRLALVTNELDLNYNDILRRSFQAEAARHGLEPGRGAC